MRGVEYGSGVSEFPASSPLHGILALCFVGLGDISRAKVALEARTIVAGETDPARLAALAQGAARNKTAEFTRRCAGASPSITARCSSCTCRSSMRSSARWPSWTPQWEKRWRHRQRARLLTTMPGVFDLTASVLVAEIGVDTDALPECRPSASPGPGCARAATRAPASARSTRVRKSGTWINTTHLVSAAWAAVRVKTSYLRARKLPAHQGAARRQESHPRGRRLDAHRRVPSNRPRHGTQDTGTSATITSTATTSPRRSAACSNGFKTSVLRCH